jgi:hypothetical protein
MFNTGLIEQAKEHFKEHRWCVIDHILQQAYVNDIYDYVENLDYGYWACVHNHHQKYTPQKVKELNEVGLRNEWRDNAKGKFGYWHRAHWLLKEEHLVAPNNPLVTEFNRVIVEDYSLSKPDPTFMELGEYVSDFTNMYTNQPTYSYYDYTSWLKAHHDPRRWMAYVFYFNREWETHWGGQLCIMNQDERTIRHNIEPFGNRLLLMDVSELAGHRINKHFISPVSYIADQPRYSLAGWFYQKETDGPSPVKSQ